jgi:hypothetical protein
MVVKQELIGGKQWAREIDSWCPGGATYLRHESEPAGKVGNW